MKLDGRKLKDARLDLGLSQSDVATKAGVAQATISNAENGLDVNPGNGRAIVDALKLKLKDTRVREESDDAA
jgi:transcriptional regulator with XRE-family HTH domain